MNSQNTQVIALIRGVLLPIWNLSVIVALSRIKDLIVKRLYGLKERNILRMC